MGGSAKERRSSPAPFTVAARKREGVAPGMDG